MISNFKTITKHLDKLDFIYQIILFKTSIMQFVKDDPQLEALWLRLSTGFVPRVIFFLMQLTIEDSND